jgi:hypothetical protein
MAWQWFLFTSPLVRCRQCRCRCQCRCHEETLCGYRSNAVNEGVPVQIQAHLLFLFFLFFLFFLSFDFDLKRHRKNMDNKREHSGDASSLGSLINAITEDPVKRPKHSGSGLGSRSTMPSSTFGFFTKSTSGLESHSEATVTWTTAGVNNTVLVGSFMDGINNVHAKPLIASFDFDDTLVTTNGNHTFSKNVTYHITFIVI